MKKVLTNLARLKVLSCVVFLGMLILFLMGKAIFYQEFNIATLDLVWLMIMAVVVAVLKLMMDCIVDNDRIRGGVAVVLLGIGVVGLMFLANWIFGLFALQGIQYLFFGLIMVLLYCGACFGFWVIGRLEIDLLNSFLTSFKKRV